MLQQLNAEAKPESESDVEKDAWDSLCAVRLSQWEKIMKRKLEAAVPMLNADIKKGFQFMQVPFLHNVPVNQAN